MKKASSHMVKSWIAAPMPRFPDRDFAVALARDGYYPSPEDAFIEVDSDRRQKVANRVAEHLENYHHPLSWQAI